MRIRSLIAVATFAFACVKQPPLAAVPIAKSTSVAVVEAEPNLIRGKVLERLDASQYTYLRLQTADGESWTAVPKTAKAVGATAVVLGPIWMENFKSSTLGRTWERIAFGTLEDEPPSAGQPAMGARPGAGPGMFAAAAVADRPVAASAVAAPAEPAPINVRTAAGPDGRTIADVYARKTQLKDKSVAIRGQVVKATSGVMGKNWLHLRDGTGTGAAADLAVVSDDIAKVGDTVLITGLVHLDRDLGSGYHYDVLVEDARVKTE